LIPANNLSKEDRKKIKLATGWERGADGFFSAILHGLPDSNKK
jgi:hypothetical protein